MLLASKQRDFELQIDNLEQYLALINQLSTAPSSITNIDLNFIINNPIEWKTIVHTATLSSLYSIYEKSVYSLFDYWIETSTRRYSSYYQISEKMRDAYRHGISTILNKLGGPRYSNLSENVIFNTISSHQSPIAPELLSLAFYTQEANLRLDVLCTIANNIELNNIRHWLSNDRYLSSSLKAIFDENSTIESELTHFIYYRNKAAHGDTAEILSPKELLNYCQLILLLLHSCCEYINFEIIKLNLKNSSTLQHIAKITEKYSNNTYIIKSSKGTLNVGETLLILGPTNYKQVQLLSIQIEDQDYHSYSWTVDTEIGIRINMPAYNTKEIYRVLEPPDFNPTDSYSI